MKRYQALLTFLITASVFLLAACQPSAEQVQVESPAEEQTVKDEESTAEEVMPDADPLVGGTMKVGISFEIDTLDPQETWSGLPHKFIFGSILYYDADNQIRYPYIGESVNVSEDGLIYTIKLKEGVTFHDGSALTSEDFVFTIERALQSNGAATYLQNFESVEALDDLTAQVNFSAPNQSFLDALCNYALAPLPKAYIEQVGNEEFINSPVGAGPMKFESYETGEKITLKRNPDFNWGPEYTHRGPVYIETLEIVTIAEYASLAAGLEAEELDLILLGNQDVERLSALDYLELYQFSERGSGMYVAMNVEKEPFDNLAFRKALNYILDRESMLKVISNGYGVPVLGPVAPNTPGSVENIDELAYSTDLEKAAQLMQEAGYTKNENGYYEKDGNPLIITLINHFAVAETTAQVLQEQLNQFGIQMQIQTLEFAVSMSTVQSGDFEMVIWGWASNDCSFLFTGFHSSNIDNGGLNLGRVSDPELDQLLEQAVATPTFEEAIPYYQEAQEIIIKNAYILPMYNSFYFQGLNSRIKNIQIFESVYDFNIFDAYIEE